MGRGRRSGGTPPPSANPKLGWRLLERLYDAAAVYFAFVQVGGAEAAMYMARDYALQRQAFGRLIGFNLTAIVLVAGGAMLIAAGWSGWRL